jgi:outer membrane protein
MRLSKGAYACITGIVMSGPIQTALAYEAGDWLVRGRIINVTPNDDSGDLYTGAGNLGEGVSVNDDTVPELDITYMLSPHWGLELILAYSQHDVDSRGAPAGLGLGKVIDAKVLPPTLTLQYHFLPNAAVRPYVGLGVNYTHFFDESVSGVLDQPGAKVKLDASWGLAAQAGVDIDINQDWFVNVDVKYIDIQTEARFSGINLVNTANINTEINPFVYGIGIGRRF